jgi:hypothetical protein
MFIDITTISTNKIFSLKHIVQWLAAGRWVPSGPLVSSSNKTDPHDITEILLKVALSIIIKTKTYVYWYYHNINEQNIFIKTYCSCHKTTKGSDNLCTTYSNVFSITLCSPTHSIFFLSLYATHSLYIPPLTLCSSTHSIFPLSLYAHPLTPYFPSHSMLTHSLYIPLSPYFPLDEFHATNEPRELSIFLLSWLIKFLVTFVLHPPINLVHRIEWVSIFPSHSMFLHSLYIPPLTICSPTHSMLTHSLYIPLSLYAHSLTLCSRRNIEWEGEYRVSGWA